MSGNRMSRLQPSQPAKAHTSMRERGFRVGQSCPSATGESAIERAMIVVERVMRPAKARLPNAPPAAPQRPRCSCACGASVPRGFPARLRKRELRPLLIAARPACSHFRMFAAQSLHGARLAAKNRAQPDRQTRPFKLAHGPFQSCAVVDRKPDAPAQRPI